MIQFICDFCSRVKNPEDIWLLGLAAESLGLTSARREVTILSGWDRDRAVHPLAVHFCSEICKDHYIEQLFGAESEEEVEQELVPEAVTAARPKPKRAVTAKTRSRKTTRRSDAA
jgi:hypothetical protein